MGFTGLSSLRYGNITANALYAIVGPPLPNIQYMAARKLDFTSISVFGTGDVDSITVLQNGTYQVYFGFNTVYIPTAMAIEINNIGFYNKSIIGFTDSSHYNASEAHIPFYWQIIMDLVEGDVLKFIVGFIALQLGKYIQALVLTMIKLA